MGKYRVLAIVFVVAAVALSDIMSANVAYEYCDMLWKIRYAGFSAPASTAFVFAIPYLAGILVCCILSAVFWKKSKRSKA